jgi:Leucine-rich repeat (LRR) protein
LALNVSLITLDLSFNKLVESGGMIGKILSEHSQRKNDILYLYSIRKLKPEFDLANTGICEVNLEGNLFNDKSI